MNIKDFIIKGDIPEKEEKISKPRNKTEYEFEIIYENDTDFILKRTTSRTEKLLVCLISQAQLYIKDNKTNKIEKVESFDDLKAFKKGMTDLPVFKKLIWEPFYEDYTGWGSDKKYFIVVTNTFSSVLYHLDTFKVLANKKLDPFKNTGLVYKYERDPEFFEKSAKCLKILQLIDPDITTAEYGFENMGRNLLDANITYNTIKANLQTINDIGVNNFKSLLKDSQFFSAMKNYLCDFKSLLNYILYTITYRNGLHVGTYGEFRMSDYVDYLRMQQEMYGKVKEKYPLYWLSEKQMTNNKYNKWRELQSIKTFSLEQEKMKPYEYSNDIFKVIVPMSSADILDEAQQQQHCVASYIERIRNGKTHILFIRQPIAEDVSCLTVEVTPDARIVQVRGFQNRDYTNLEYSFLKEWAEAKDLKLEVPEVV